MAWLERMQVVPMPPCPDWQAIAVRLEHARLEVDLKLARARKQGLETVRFEANPERFVYLSNVLVRAGLSFCHDPVTDEVVVMV